MSSWKLVSVTHCGVAVLCSHTHRSSKPASKNNHNNNNTIWGGSVFTGEEPPPHSGELNHALFQAGGPTQSQLSRPMSSRHHISMEHRLRRKHPLLNLDTNARKEKSRKTLKENKKKKTRKRKRWKKTGEEPPPHSGELKHALPQAGGPTQSQLSRPMSSAEHRLRRKQLNSDTNASIKKYLKEIQEKRKEDTFFSGKMKKENEKHKKIKKWRNEQKMRKRKNKKQEKRQKNGRKKKVGKKGKEGPKVYSTEMGT